MKFELNESELKRDLDWLKREDNALNSYATVIKYLLNEIEKLKQEQEPRSHETMRLKWSDWKNKTTRL